MPTHYGGLNELKGRSSTCLFCMKKMQKIFKKTIDKCITECYNIGVIKRGKPQKERKMKNERILV